MKKLIAFLMVTTMTSQMFAGAYTLKQLFNSALKDADTLQGAAKANAKKVADAIYSLDNSVFDKDDYELAFGDTATPAGDIIWAAKYNPPVNINKFGALWKNQGPDNHGFKAADAVATEALANGKQYMTEGKKALQDAIDAITNAKNSIV